MVFKHTKRAFSDDESCQLAYKKHQKQLDYSSQIAAFVEIVPCNSAPQKICFTAGEGEKFTKSQQDTNPNPSALEPKVTSSQEIANGTASVISGSASANDSWVPITYREDDGISDSAVQVSCSLVLHECPRDIYSSLIDDFPRKPIPIGPDHQADIPVCYPRETTSCFSRMCMPAPTVGAVSGNGVAFPPKLYLLDNEEDMKRFQGTCVIPMPDTVSCADDGRESGHSRIDCGCIDYGSIRCVRQHIAEERDQLKIKLGVERFMQLGFCEMGEEVAKKWSADDEQLFCGAVYSNPASSGRNFWDQLSVVLPFRTKKELISYYFNVFVLRRRAQQNRWDPFHADSDDDEWLLSDDEEPAVTEEDEDEDEDSVVDDLDVVDHDDIFSVDQENHDANDDDDVHREGSKSHDRSCSMDPAIQLRENTGNGAEDQDLQDDSCTSYECHHNRDDHPCNPSDVVGKQGGLVEGDNKNSNSEYLNNSSGGMIAHGYVGEPCDPKVWDIGYLTGSSKEVDFLPTCNVIKEVLGEEAWNNETMRDGPGIS